MVEVKAEDKMAIVAEKEEKANDVKHLLENKWTLWFFKNDRARQWEENQVEVATFDTVEDFWALYNHVEFAGRLPVGCDYSLFKAGIKPAWEDVRNRNGGRWVITLDRAHKNDTDKFWVEIMMMLVGEAFETENQHICGAVVSLRSKCDRIAVWIGCDAKQEQSILKIGHAIKDRLKLGARILCFQTHADTSNKSGSSAKNTYQV